MLRVQTWLDRVTPRARRKQVMSCGTSHSANASLSNPLALRFAECPGITTFFGWPFWLYLLKAIVLMRGLPFALWFCASLQAGTYGPQRMDSCRGSERLGAGPPTIGPVAASGCLKFEGSAGAQVVSRSTSRERFRQDCSTSEGERRSTSSPPHSKDEPDGRSRKDLPDPGFHRGSRDDDPEEVEVLKRALEAQMQARRHRLLRPFRILCGQSTIKRSTASFRLVRF